LGLALGYCIQQSQRPDEAPREAATAPQGVQPAAVPAEASDHEKVEPPPDPIAQEGAAPYAPDTFREPFFPFLDAEDPLASVSIGTVTEGYQVNARPMPLPGDAWQVLPRQWQRRLLYGTDELIALLQEAGRALHAKHGVLLWLGNIGKRGGGDIAWSVSHNSGRDADLAFCYVGPDDKPVDPPDLVQLDASGRSLQYDGHYRFDAVRTWTLVRSLLTSRQAHIQYIFVSNPLKKKLLAEAKRRKEPAWLLTRADEVLNQPGGAAPHDDHLHIRLACPDEDVSGGCLDFGPLPTSATPREKLLSEAFPRIAARLKRDDAELRARAIERLGLLRAASFGRELQRRLDDPSPRVRAASARTLGQLRLTAATPDMLSRFEREDDPAVMEALLRGLVQAGSPKAGHLLHRVIADKTYERAQLGALPHALLTAYTPPPAADEPAPDPALLSPNRPKFAGVALDLSAQPHHVRLAAVELAADCECAEPVPALIEALRDPSPLLRGRAARALHRLTNHALDVRWDDPALGAEDLETGVRAWLDWWSKLGKQPRVQWVVAGFRARGFEVHKLDTKDLWELTRATLSDDHLSYNAQQFLAAITQEDDKSLGWPKDDACWHWTKHLKKNRRKYRLGDVPPTLAACNK
jgi:penicillin-insensitive murein endopeptidase